MNQTWTIEELQAELYAFEAEARAAGLKDSSLRTFVDRSQFFVRWLAGDFEFRGPNR